MKTVSELPLYLRIADDLRAQLILLPVGAPFETEQTLTDRYGVSRGTIRQALDVLVQEGILTRTQGSGSYRSQPTTVPYRFTLTQELTDSIRAVGSNSAVRNLSVTLVPAPRTIADQLHIPIGTKVRKVVRVRTVDGKPIAFGTGYLRTDQIPAFNKRDYQTSLGNMVRNVFKIHIAERFCDLMTEAADETVADMLLIPLGTPVLKICVYCIGYGGVPLLTDIFCFPSSQTLHFQL